MISHNVVKNADLTDRFHNPPSNWPVFSNRYINCTDEKDPVAVNLTATIQDHLLQLAK